MQLQEYDNNLHEQLISRAWLRHSTVDRRTLRPLSMVHLDPCQQPCCPTRILPSVQQTCNTEERRNTSNQSSALTHDSIHISRRRGETEIKGKTSYRGDFSSGKKESCMTITLIFMTHPLYTLLDLHLSPTSVSPRRLECPATLPPCLSLPLSCWDLQLMEWPWRDCRFALNITLLSHCVASS